MLFGQHRQNRRGLFKKKQPEPQRFQQKIPTTPTEYPDGSVVVTESGRWYIKGKFKFLIPTDQVFRSWSFPLIINGSDVTISKYIKNGKLGFRAGSLLYNDGRYYFISGNELRKISGPDAFVAFGLDPQTALWVSDEELLLHKAGEVF
jgi:hypothetical protein